MIHPFVLQLNSLDPPTTKEGKPYGPAKYKEIVYERYFIARNTSTSYEEVGNISPRERSYLIEFLQEEQAQVSKRLQQLKSGQEVD